jgi:hypothetical protein
MLEKIVSLYCLTYYNEIVKIANRFNPRRKFRAPSGRRSPLGYFGGGGWRADDAVGQSLWRRPKRTLVRPTYRIKIPRSLLRGILLKAVSP